MYKQLRWFITNVTSVTTTSSSTSCFLHPGKCNFRVVFTSGTYKINVKQPKCKRRLLHLKVCHFNYSGYSSLNLCNSISWEWWFIDVKFEYTFEQWVCYTLNNTIYVFYEIFNTKGTKEVRKQYGIRSSSSLYYAETGINNDNWNKENTFIHLVYVSNVIVRFFSSFQLLFDCIEAQCN